MFVHRVCMCTFLSRATADSTWLLKQLKKLSSRPQASKAAGRGYKRACPDSGLQIAEIRWKEELHWDLSSTNNIAVEIRLPTHVEVLNPAPVGSSKISTSYSSLAG